MKKKALALILTFAMICAFSLSACGGGSDSGSTEEGIEETAALKSVLCTHAFLPMPGAAISLQFP